MNKTLFYIAVILNIIMFVVFLSVITVGISDELASGMVEKTRMFFAMKKLDIYLISIFGVLLPFINMFFLFKVNVKSKV